MGSLQPLVTEQQLREEAMKEFAERTARFGHGAGQGQNANVSIEDGTGGAYGARVNGENNMGVEARHGRTDIAKTFVQVGTTSQQVVAAEDKRLQVTLQNLHDVNSLFLNLGSAATANQDLKLPPGAMYSLPPGVAFTGAIHAVASAADTGVVVVEYKVA